MGGKRLRFFNFWELLRLCWLFSWWASIGATLVATYILGNCWRCFLEQLEVGEKNPSDCYGLPTAAQISPPPPHAHIYSIWGRGSTSWEIIWVGKLSPHLLQESVTFDGPPPPPTPSWEEPPGVLGIRTGYLKINSVGISFRKIPASPRTCYTPSPSPPQLSWGGGDEARGVLPS